jgi:hypothetical protein
MKLRNAVFAAGMLLCCSAHAGPYTDDLSKCLVQSTSPADRLILVRWIFAAMSHHPAVASMTRVTAQDADRIDAQMADLFTRLLTVSCQSQAKLALAYEGDQAMSQSFSLLGQVAGKEIFSDQNVQHAMTGLKNHLDIKRLQKLMPTPPPPPPPPGS